MSPTFLLDHERDSQHGAYITHIATLRLSDITGGNLRPQDLETHTGCVKWVELPFN